MLKAGVRRIPGFHYKRIVEGVFFGNSIKHDLCGSWAWGYYTRASQQACCCLRRPAAVWSPPPCRGAPSPRHGCFLEGLCQLEVRLAAPAGHRAVPLNPRSCWGSLDLPVCSGRWLGGRQLTFWGVPLRSWQDPCSGHLKHLRISGLLALRASQCSCFLLIF